jgi:hypothetical protein
MLLWKNSFYVGSIYKPEPAEKDYKVIVIS